MKLVIPMSGIGSRFLEAGYSMPKPLIRVNGKHIIEHVLDAFPGSDDIIFICNNDHLAETNMEEVLRKLRPESTIFGIEPHKKGPVFALTRVFSAIPDNEAIMVSYCDYGQVWDYEAFKAKVAEENFAGAVPAYTGFHPHLLHKKLYAGILVDERNRMTAIKEKHSFTENPEDSHHSPGSYYFKSGALLKKYATELMEQDININGEYYVSSVYELMLRDNLKIYVPELTHFMQWGTPEDLEEYEAWSRRMHADLRKEKATTDIPDVRSSKIAILHPEETSEFKKSYGYWKQYFESI